jgi:branched-chain amino acid transport system substrate-binding protein
VLAIIGSLGSPTNASVQRYLNDRKVPQLFLFTGAARFRDRKPIRGR